MSENTKKLRIRQYKKPYLSTEGKLVVDRMTANVTEAKGYKIISYNEETHGIHRVLLPKSAEVSSEVYLLSGQGKWIFYTPRDKDSLSDAVFASLCGIYVMNSLQQEYNLAEKKLNEIGSWMNDLSSNLNL